MFSSTDLHQLFFEFLNNWDISSFFWGVFAAVSFAVVIFILLISFFGLLHRYHLSRMQQSFFFDWAPVAFFRLNAKGKIISWNAEAQRITGYSFQEVNRKKLPVFTDTTLPTPSFSGQRNFFVFNTEGTLKTKRGENLLISKNLSFIFNENGGLGEIIGSFRDITEERHQAEKSEKQNEKLEHQQDTILKILHDIEEEKQKSQHLIHDLRKFELAVEQASDHIIITDPKGFVLVVNNAAEKLTGFSREEIVGKKAGTHENWGGMMDKDFYKELWETISEEKKIFHGELKNRKKNGEIYSVLVSISPILDEKGEILFFVSIERDITQEKNIDRAKSEFVSLASHQLRTPLTTLNWYTELLLNGEAGKITKKQKEFLQEVARGGERMKNLVNALLNVSRIDLGALAINPKPVFLHETLHDVLQELRPFTVQKKIRIVTKVSKDLPTIFLDPNLIHIVFQNLIGNAVKYTPEKGSVSIHIYQKNGLFQILVSDTGYGIPEHQQEKIFSKLFRADNVQKKEVDGNGLGLYITKSIVEEFGGTILFTSQENIGTTFTVSLPEKGITEQKEGKHLNFSKTSGISSGSLSDDLGYET